MNPKKSRSDWRKERKREIVKSKLGSTFTEEFLMLMSDVCEDNNQSALMNFALLALHKAVTGKAGIPELDELLEHFNVAAAELEKTMEKSSGMDPDSPVEKFFEKIGKDLETVGSDSEEFEVDEEETLKNKPKQDWSKLTNMINKIKRSVKKDDDNNEEGEKPDPE